MKEVILDLQSIRVTLSDGLAERLINGVMTEEDKNKLQDEVLYKIEDEGLQIESVEED